MKKSQRHHQRDYLAASDLRGFSLNVLGIVATLMGTAGALAVTQKPQQSTPPVDRTPSETPSLEPPTPILTPPLAQAKSQLGEKIVSPPLLPERSALEFSHNRPALDPLLSEIRQSLGRSNFQPPITARESASQPVPAQLRSQPFRILPTALAQRPEMVLKSTQPLPTEKVAPVQVSEAMASQEPIPQPTPLVSPEPKRDIRLALSDAVALALENDVPSSNISLEQSARGQNLAPNSAIAAEFNSEDRTKSDRAKIQASRATRSDKITETILAYRELQRAQEGLKIEQQSLVLAQAIPEVNRAEKENAIANRQLALSEAQQRLAAAKLALLDILALERTHNPIAAETPTAQSVTLNTAQLQQLASETQNGSGSLPIQLRDAIRNVQWLLSQMEQAQQETALARSQLQSEWEKQGLGQDGSIVELVKLHEELVRSRHAELNATIDYLKVLAQLEQSVGTPLDARQLTAEPGESQSGVR